MEQQNNNKNQPIGRENPSMDADTFLSPDEIEDFKSIPTTIHVILKVIKNGVVVDKQDTSFISEDEADMFLRTLATTVSGLPLDFWNSSSGDIAVYYSLIDPDNQDTMFRITIYPKTFKIIL